MSSKILIFDSGLGGLTVYDEVKKALPQAQFVYAADDAGFPYGPLDQDMLVARVNTVMDTLITEYKPDLVVIACNTASTLVLPHLRARFSVPFVGTVPAIKPAAALSNSRCFTVLATPGTVARDYTRDLIDAYAQNCQVTLVGSQHLARFAEAELMGKSASDDAILEEIKPCFIEQNGVRTDIIVQACTHYPLLKHRFEKLSPWSVLWLDPAPAIASRVMQVLGYPSVQIADTSHNLAIIFFTSRRALSGPLQKALIAKGFDTSANSGKKTL